MPKVKRKKENTGLPGRWRFRYGAYYYRVPLGLEHKWDNKDDFRLGSTLSEAHRVFAERIGVFENATTMSKLFDRYEFTVVPDKAAPTQKSNRISLRRLRTVFGDNDLRLIRADHCLQYREAITKSSGATSANRDLEVLSHAFSMAILWGLLPNSDHPMRGLRMKNPKKKRQRYVTDEELDLALTVASPFLLAYIELKGLTGLRKGDILRIQLSDIKSDGIHVTPHKTADSTGRKKTIPRTPDIEQAITAIMALRGKVSGLYLFCTRAGAPYIDADGVTSGFDSVWQRFMKKVVGLGVPRFTEHDLRAKVASDANKVHAQALLDHSTSVMTETYRRKAEVVQPAAGFGRAKKTDSVGE